MGLEAPRTRGWLIVFCLDGRSVLLYWFSTDEPTCPARQVRIAACTASSNGARAHGQMGT